MSSRVAGRAFVSPRSAPLSCGHGRLQGMQRKDVVVVLPVVLFSLSYTAGQYLSPDLKPTDPAVLISHATY